MGETEHHRRWQISPADNRFHNFVLITMDDFNGNNLVTGTPQTNSCRKAISSRA